MRKVLVMGSPGAGKSTFARRLGAALGLPVIHLDQLFWNPGWVQTPRPLFREKVEAAVGAPAWVIDGEFHLGHIEARIAAADTVIYLDTPRLICMWRIVLRILRGHGRVRADMPEGCPEQFSWDFIKYAWTHRRVYRPQTLAYIAQSPDKKVILTGHPAVELYLQSLRP